MSAITLNDINVSVDTIEPRIQDFKLAEALGFENLYNVRKLISRHIKTLKTFGEIVFSTVEKTAENKGGRPGKEYWLNEKQALFLCTKSDAKNAIDITIQMVEVFYAVKTGQQPSLPRPQKLSNTQRRNIQQLIADRFANQDQRRQAFDQLKAQFDVSRYWDIPTTAYDDAVALIREMEGGQDPFPLADLQSEASEIAQSLQQVQRQAVSLFSKLQHNRLTRASQGLLQ